MKSAARRVLLGLCLATTGVHAHGGEEHVARAFEPRLAEQKDFGIAADPKAATRTMTISMSDRMRFSPSSITLKLGETVRFVVRNEGKLMHELVLGTKTDLDHHAELMKKFPNMEHDEPHMLHVPAGKSGAIAWKFNRRGDFDFACLIPGHYDAGMKGRIVVR